MKKTAQIFKSLADQTRLRIISLLLASKEELCVCDFMVVLDLPQSTVSRHLACLRHADLVRDRRHGVWMYYRLFRDNDELRSGLLAVLENVCQNLAQAGADRERLARHIETKQANSCGQYSPQFGGNNE